MPNRKVGRYAVMLVVGLTTSISVLTAIFALGLAPGLPAHGIGPVVKRARVLPKSAENPGPPTLVSEPGTRDVGDVRQGGTVETSFQLRNVGREVIRVTEIEKECSCTQATLSGSVIAPGESVWLDAQWKTGRSRGRSGTRITAWYSSTNRGANGVSMIIVGDVVPDVSWEPDGLFFDGKPDETQVVKVTLQSGVRILGSTTSDSHFGVDMTPCVLPDTGRRVYEVRVRISSTELAERGRAKDFLFIDTDSPWSPTISVPLELR